jgi:hypothetical protein
LGSLNRKVERDKCGLLAKEGSLEGDRKRGKRTFAHFLAAEERSTPAAGGKDSETRG